jgi:hypothetical protein
MKHSELKAAALIARPVETKHHAGGMTVRHYEIDPRFDPKEWGLALLACRLDVTYPNPYRRSYR